MSSRTPSAVAPRRLVLRLLGAPLVEVDGRVVETDTRKAVALLAYLAVTGSAQSREKVAALLWPEYDAAHAGAALRRTLSVGRAALGGRWLVPSGRLLALETRDLRCDLLAFRAAREAVTTHHPAGELACDRCRVRLERALALWRGDFLEGFSLRDSPEFDDWQSATATELRSEVADLLQRLTDAAAAGGRWEAALSSARRWLALDPLHEPAHRRLMQLHAASGDRSAALRQYRDCVRILDDELGVPPLPETTATYERIASGEVGAQPRRVDEGRPASQPVESRARLPFVGRAAELARLAALYDACTERGRLALVEGEAGIGKSRLVEELVTLVARHGGRVVITRGYRDPGSVAYASVADGLRDALRRDAAWAEQLPPHARSSVAQLIPELGRGGASTADDAGGELDGEAARIRFLNDLAAALAAALDGPRPGLLVVDDAQWLDAASADVLAHLARRLAELSLCLVLCRRAEELADDRLDALRREARRGDLLGEVRLGRLEAADVRSLVAASGQGSEVAELLVARSEGIPFFVVEYLDLLRRGATADDGRLLPEGIRDLVASRLEGGGAAARQVLSAAAVIGRSFDPELVRAASGRSPEETVRALEELLALGLIRERQEAGAYDFDHEVTRDVVLAETGLARSRLLHRRVADALVQRPGTPGGGSGAAAVLAGHYRAARDEREAARLLRQAGEEAERLYANSEAREHYREALALDPTHAAELHERIGDLETLLGRYADAVASYESAAALAGEAELPRIEQRLGQLHHRRGEWALADTHLAAALAVLPADATDARARVLADRSLTAHRRGDPEGAAAFAGQALELATAGGDPATLAQVHNLLGILAKGSGDLETARGHLERSLEHAVTQPRARIAALNNLALVARAAGQPQRAIELTDAALRLCTALGDRHREAALRNNLADLLHAAGRADEAMAELTRSVTIFTEIGEPGTMQPEIWKLVEW
jgi:DNA-binding SARP family transcriptional activator/Tfp pilus assembly protein PilF